MVVGDQLGQAVVRVTWNESVARLEQRPGNKELQSVAGPVACHVRGPSRVVMVTDEV